MKNLTLIFISIFVSFQMMAGMESHPFNNKHSYQTFKNISLLVDANLVNTIFQDQEGMIWLGTKRGLYSYNGYDLHEYIDEMYPNGNPVFSIVQTSADYLCLGTDNGVRWFNLTDRRIEHLSFDAGLSMAVRSLSLFGEYLWVGTRDNGLIRMSLSKGTVEAIGLHEKMRQPYILLNLLLINYSLLHMSTSVIMTRRMIPDILLIWAVLKG